MSVQEAQNKIDSREFAEWMAYFDLEPFGYERYEVSNAILGCLLASIFGSKKGDFKLEDFMPKYGEEPERKDPKLSIKDFESLCKALSKK